MWNYETGKVKVIKKKLWTPRCTWPDSAQSFVIFLRNDSAFHHVLIFIIVSFSTRNPLTTTRYKSAAQLSEFPAILVWTDISVNFTHFYTAVCSKKHQFFIYTTHFRSVFVPKSRFFRRKGVHCSGALLIKRKRFCNIS